MILPFSWRNRILHSLIFGCIVIAIMSPFTYLNYRNSGGKFIPVATTGSNELYMGNNRDSAGRHSNTFAHQNIDMPYIDAIWRDARVAPEHFYGLFAYKFALFWSDLEPGNNLSFETSNELTRSINFSPLRFTWLMIPGLIGLSVLWYHHRETAIFFGLMIAWMCFGYVLVFAFGRIRFPAVVPMTLLASFGIVALFESLLYGIPWIRTIKRHTVMLMALIVLTGFMNWTLFPSAKLPLERTYRELPADAIRLDARFGDVTLVGWRTLDEWDHVRNGWVPVFESYAVELFWQIENPTDIIYNFFFAYIDDGQRFDAIDIPIGAVSFPATTTDNWKSDRIYGEILSLRLDEDIPQARSAQIRVGVWYWDDEGLIVNVPLENDDENVLIQDIAVFNNGQTPPASDLTASDFIFGDVIALKGYDIPETATVNEILKIPFYLEATNNIVDDYRMFLHLVDDTGEIITQSDNRPVPELFTYNWMVGYPLYSELSLTMPDTPGSYRILGGLYNDSGRLATNTPDDRVLLAEITVE